jgi:hypothetical protein
MLVEREKGAGYGDYNVRTNSNKYLDKTIVLLVNAEVENLVGVGMHKSFLLPQRWH